MAFRRIPSRPTRSGPEVSLAYSGGPPRIRIAEHVLAMAGIKRQAKVDLMIDTDASPNRLAIVSGGQEIRLTNLGKKSSLFTTTRLATFVPKMKATEVQWEVGTVEDRPAIIVTIPTLPLSR